MKREARKLIYKKYSISLLLGLLSLLYLYMGDWLFGYGLGNISFIMNYLLFSFGEKLTAFILLLCLLVPDIYGLIKGAYPGRGAER